MNPINFFEYVERNEISSITLESLIPTNINVLNNNGSTALHLAVYHGYDIMTHHLIKLGANANLQNKDGKTCLHYTAEYNRIEIAKILLSNNASLSIADNYGNQPLWTAVFNDKGRNDRRELIELFISHGADKHHQNNVAKSPLDIVKIASYKNLEKIFDL
ncbi:ankyrin repeat domain-containing protein [Mucilaginibacter terrenus]|uniref:Ankyrin repeat domain-containing protein n=1 Tax=Mucilaginibacter terrenus TaxID=2482727 RepID=A0A3E2NPY0_9SPHI|nr:ankyrin repeat domain-containing protein [Mucilaginibacter terrenus]RFZ83044.1 ankyrin repeat domain-containing protein [Mucilaginibacter terrenus]